MRMSRTRPTEASQADGAAERQARLQPHYFGQRFVLAGPFQLPSLPAVSARRLPTRDHRVSSCSSRLPCHRRRRSGWRRKACRRPRFQQGGFAVGNAHDQHAVVQAVTASITEWSPLAAVQAGGGGEDRCRLADQAAGQP